VTAFLSWFLTPWRFAALLALAAALTLIRHAIRRGTFDPHEGAHAAPRRDLGWPELEQWAGPQLALSAAETLVSDGHSATWAPRFQAQPTEVIDYDAWNAAAEHAARYAPHPLPPAVTVTDDPPAGRHEAPRVHPFTPGGDPYCGKCGKAGHWRGDEPCPDRRVDELITRRRDGHVTAAITAHLEDAGFRAHGGDTAAMLDSIIGGIPAVPGD